jgi:hypothetical protein
MRFVWWSRKIHGNGLRHHGLAAARMGMSLVGNAEKQGGRPVAPLGWGPSMARDPSTLQRATRVLDPWDVDGDIILPLTSGKDIIKGHMGFWSGAIRLATTEARTCAREWTEPVATGLCRSLGGPARPVTTATYANPPSAGPSCRLPSAASSPVEPWLAGPSLNKCPGAGRRLEGSYEPSELESSSAFLLLTGSCGDSLEVRALLPNPLWRSRTEALVALALKAARAFFLLPAATAFASSRRKTGESSIPTNQRANWGRRPARKSTSLGPFSHFCVNRVAEIRNRHLKL